MSYVEQGTIAATVIVSSEPDRSGNFVCNGVEDNVEIQASWDYVTALGGGLAYIGQGNYDCQAALIPDPPLEVIGAGIDATILRLHAGNVHNLIEYTGAVTKQWFYLRRMTLHGQTAGGDGIHIVPTANRLMDCLYEDLLVISFLGDGVRVEPLWGTIFRNVISEFNGGHGFDLGGGIIGWNHSGRLLQCKSGHNTGSGFYVGAWRMDFTDCQSFENEQRGWWVLGFECTIKGGWTVDNSQVGIGVTDGIVIQGDRWVISNHIIDGGAQQRYGIWITAGADNNVLRNLIIANNTVAPLLDEGGDTDLPSKTFQFIQGTTFISADGSAKGWEIDAEADMSIALGQLPSGVQQVVRIKIWAVALGAPGAGGQMLLDIVIQAGADDLVYTTENINLPAFESVTTDYVANDVVHWSVDVTDDADIGDLAAGMSLECKINGAPVSAPDEATNATFRAIEIEYV